MTLEVAAAGVFNRGFSRGFGQPGPVAPDQRHAPGTPAAGKVQGGFGKQDRQRRGH